MYFIAILVFLPEYGNGNFEANGWVSPYQRKLIVVVQHLKHL